MPIIRNKELCQLLEIITNQPVTKIYSVGFNIDAELSCKNESQRPKIKPFWEYFKCKNQAI